MIRLIAYTLIVVIVLWCLHLLIRWAERKGWVLRRPSVSSVGNAFFEIEALVRPAARHELEVREQDTIQIDESGEPLEPERSIEPERPSE